MIALGVIFAIPAVLIMILIVLAVCKVSGRESCEEELHEQLRDKVEVFNPPGPRYL